MSPKLSSAISYFIMQSRNAGQNDLTNKKLQKLLYYAQAWNLVLRKKELFKEDFEAWVHGPAIPVVYQAFRDCGASVITIDVEEKDLKNLSADEQGLLNEVWQVYGKYDASYLELLTHNEVPWLKARNGSMPYEASNAAISKKAMREYYEQKAKAQT
jgi:uncharacterized phage-associated protein